MSTKDLKEKGTHFLLLTGSTLLMAVGTYFFKFTNNFTFGGITGLAVLIAKTGVMSAGDFNLIASMARCCTILPRSGNLRSRGSAWSRIIRSPAS